MTFIGLDGCRAGWLTVSLDDRGGWAVGIDPSLEAVLHRHPAARHVLVDIPIGLPSGPEPRECDVAARRLLGDRGSSVFPAPSRAALAASSFEEAGRLNREATGKGLSLQAWHIVPKIREVDELLRSDPAARRIVREAHPEVLFHGLAGAPIRESKKRVAGREERLQVLERFFPPARDVLDRARATLRRDLFQPDDVVDALACAVAARHGRFRTLPDRPPTDAEGLPMEMVYVDAS